MDQLLSAAGKAYNAKNYDEAVELFGQACGDYVSEHGEENPDILFQYGRALFKVASKNASFLYIDNVQKRQLPEESAEPEDENNGDFYFEEDEDASEPEPKEESNETAGAASTKSEPKETEEPETEESREVEQPKTEDSVKESEELEVASDQEFESKPAESDGPLEDLDDDEDDEPEQAEKDEDQEDQEDEDEDEEEGEEGEVEQGDEQEGQEQDQEGEEQEEQDEDDFTIAWNVLDVCRVMYEKQLTGEKAKDRPIQLKLADTFALLGEISIEDDNCPQAVEDFKLALKVKEKLYPEDSPVLSEAHYMLALAHEFRAEGKADSEAALEHLKTALEIAKKSNTDPEAIQELQTKVDDMEQDITQGVDKGTLSNATEGILGRDAVGGVLGDLWTGAADISSIVRRKDKKKRSLEDASEPAGQAEAEEGEQDAKRKKE